MTVMTPWFRWGWGICNARIWRSCRVIVGRRRRRQGGRWWVNKGELVKFSFKHKKSSLLFRRAILYHISIVLYSMKYYIIRLYSSSCFFTIQRSFAKNNMIAGLLDMHVVKRFQAATKNNHHFWISQGSLNYPILGKNQTIQYGNLKDFPLIMHGLGW